ncbi:MAG: hypothetical protein JW913_05525 [Chitinispirillaceae bacterium]|nr:hypothetical protein [Chitinispirillaceae bacterium]
MFNNPLLNALLQKLPQNTWNELSNFYTFFTLPTIGSPIAFRFKKFHLQEYTTTEMPQSVLTAFLRFCFPTDMSNRQEEIDCDKLNYREKTSTFLVYKDTQIVGCVQIVPKTETQSLPVEFASIESPDGLLSKFNIFVIIPNNNVMEIYRCRRSFDLGRIEAINVLLMLYKAVWAKVIQLGTAYTCISFDSSKKDLRSLYLNKLAFIDPNITLIFGDNRMKWNLLIKDWKKHELFFATLSKSHFYIQTWFRMSLKKKHLHVAPSHIAGKVQKVQLIKDSNVVIAQTILSSRRRPKKATFQNRIKKPQVR